MTATTLNPPSVPTVPFRLVREIEGIYPSPGLHWVGDGFRVAGYFSVIPNAVKKLSPFLMLDYHPSYNYEPTTQPRGVGVHPHRGFETVTIAWEGSVSHHDSAGGGGTIGPGDAQWMTAASGVLHKEYHQQDFARRGGAFHMAQLWVNLPRKFKMSAPRYQGILAEQMGLFTLPANAGSVRVLAGEYEGAKGPAQTFTPMNVFDVRLNTKGAVDFNFPKQHNAGLLVMSGEVRINGTVVKENDFVVFKNAGEHVHIEANHRAQLLVLSGEPIEEPIAQYGPFVMNTEQEIRQAFVDFSGGKFGHLDD